jgi:hypothetical protein
MHPPAKVTLNRSPVLSDRGGFVQPLAGPWYERLERSVDLPETPAAARRRIMEWDRFDQTGECAPRARPSSRHAGLIADLRQGDRNAWHPSGRRACDRGRRMKVAA